MKWIGPEVAGLERARDGTALDTPGNRQAVRAFCFDAGRLAAYVAPRYAGYLAQYGDPLEAWSRWNKPGVPSSKNPNRGAYARALAEAETYRIATEVSMNDLRGQLPTLPGAVYGERPLDGIVGVTLHYTTGPASLSAAAVARYQISPEAIPQTGTGTPFPGIAYTFLVTEDGRPNLCWGLETRVWHSAAKVNGFSRNLTHVGICYTGDGPPNRAQIRGLAEAIHWTEQQLGRRLVIEGHKDPPHDTSCPGEAWPAWRGGVERELATIRSGQDADGLTVSEHFRSFLRHHPEWGRPRFDEATFEGGAAVWTTPTAEHPKGGLLVYRTWLDEVRALGWE